MVGDLYDYKAEQRCLTYKILYTFCPMGDPVPEDVVTEVDVEDGETYRYYVPGITSDKTLLKSWILHQKPSFKYRMRMFDSGRDIWIQEYID